MSLLHDFFQAGFNPLEAQKVIDLFVRRGHELPTAFEGFDWTSLKANVGDTIKLIWLRIWAGSDLIVKHYAAMNANTDPVIRNLISRLCLDDEKFASSIGGWRLMYCDFPDELALEMGRVLRHVSPTFRARWHF